jgi:hypothetical protein
VALLDFSPLNGFSSGFNTSPRKSIPVQAGDTSPVPAYLWLRLTFLVQRVSGDGSFGATVRLLPLGPLSQFWFLGSAQATGVTVRTQRHLIVRTNSIANTFTQLENAPNPTITYMAPLLAEVVGWRPLNTTAQQLGFLGKLAPESKDYITAAQQDFFRI